MGKKLQPILFYIVFFLSLFALNLISDNYDYDLFARLIVGKCFMQTGQVLKHDFLSYTPTHTIFDHEWGSGIIFYLAQHYFSYFGLLLLQIIILFVIFFIITKIVKLRGVETTTPYNFLFYFFASSAFMQVFYQPIRCQIFSFLFFTLFLYILELARKGENRPLFTIPFLMIIWNNLHGGCVAGIGLIAMYIIGEFINKKPVKKYIIVFLLSFLVLPINPWGIDYLIFLLKANTMHRTNILEWMGLFSPQYKYIYLEFKYFVSIILLFEVGYIIKSIKSKSFVFDATKYLVIITTLFLAVQHIKLIPIAVIAMSAFLYDDFYTFFNFITRGTFNKIAPVKDILVYIIAIILIFINIRKTHIGPFLDFNKFPVLAIEFIKINGIKGNLLTNFELGSYASYKLYPNNKIFMDGRYEEVYYDFMNPMLDRFMLGGDTQNELLKTFPPNLILLYKECGVYGLLLNNPDWVQIFTDNRFALFIERKNLGKTYKIPSRDIDYYKKTLFDTNINFRG